MNSPSLEGPRLRLREPRVEDHLTLFRWYNDPEIVAPFDRFSVDRFSEFEEALRDASADPTSTAPRFVLERKSDGRLLGFAGYYRAHRVLTLWDVWYVLGDPSARGQGYASEGVAVLVDFLFRELHLQRVGATCDIENVASSRLLERVGFHREGTLRDAFFHHARWHDAFVYGVTLDDWTARGRGARTIVEKRHLQSESENRRPPGQSPA